MNSCSHEAWRRGGLRGASSRHVMARRLVDGVVLVEHHNAEEICAEAAIRDHGIAVDPVDQKILDHHVGVNQRSAGRRS